MSYEWDCLLVDGCWLTGEICSVDADCCLGWCLKRSGAPLGYCTERSCLNDDSCVNNGEDDAEMCCVDLGGGFFVCLKIEPDYGCGDRSGQCGASCVGQLDSACDPSQVCLMDDLEDPDAVCTHECTSDDDCAECTDPDDADREFTCAPIQGGATYCLP